MNVLSRLKPESEMRLADMPARPLGTLTVSPATLEVIGPEGAVALEPRCMKVLVVLCEYGGRTVSRDLLIDRCWGGRIVTDGALNRCIAQVRRALSCDPSLSVDTIPRVGYRLRVPETSAQAVPEGMPVKAKRPLWWMAAAAGVALVAGALYVTLNGGGGWQGDQVRPLTAETGVESYPALDPLGTRLAYAHTGPDGNWDLYVKNVDGSGQRALTATPLNEIWPVWRGDGQALAFVRTGAGQCEIVVLDIVSQAQTVATTCDPAHVGRVVWMGRDHLLYSDAAEVGDQSALWRLSLNGGDKRMMTVPSGPGVGDMDPVISPDGRRLLFRRTLAWGVDDLMVAQLSPQGELSDLRALTRDGWKAHGTAWSADGRDVFFTSNRGGDWGLWSVSAEGGTPRRIGLGTTAMTKIASAGQTGLVTEVYQPRSDLRWLGDAAPVAEPIMADIWSLSPGPQGQLAFISNESGRVDVWLRDRVGARRLTDLKSSYVYSPVWIGDSALAFVSIVERTSQIFSVRTDGGAPVQLTRDNNEKRDLAVLPGSGQLIYIGRSGGDCVITTLPVAGGAMQTHMDLGPQWLGLASHDSIVVGWRKGDGFVYRLYWRDGAVVAEQTAVPVLGWPFAVTSSGMVHVTQGRIEQIGWDGSREELARLPQGMAPPAEIRVDEAHGGRILILDRSGNESNIALMTLTRQ